MRLMCLLAISFLLTGCITTYRDFPVEALDVKPVPAAGCETMHYNVRQFEFLSAGGYNRLQEIFRGAPTCTKMVKASVPPAKGPYVEVETKWRPMGLPALVFGYISISTFTILPAWSTQEGYDVNYHLYADGEKKETFAYPISRKGALWLGLLPFSWANFVTYSEEDAFQATAYKFLQDAKPYLASQSQPR